MFRNGKLVASIVVAGWWGIAAGEELHPQVSFENAERHALVVVEKQRASIVTRIVADWSDALPGLAPERALTKEALSVALWELRADRLLAASLAGSFATIEALLADARDEALAISAAAPAHTNAKAIGDANADLSYTPVNPCRIADTRVAGGPLGANVSRTFDGFNASSFAFQGGTATSCGMPNGVAAIAMNVYAVNPTNLGFIKLWPANGSEPAVSTVNYQTGIVAIATGAIVPVDAANSNRFIAKSPAGVDFVADVVGYFRAPTGLIAGSGTTNRVPLWTGGKALGDSLISQSGSDILVPNRMLFAAGAAGNSATMGSPNSETGLTFAGPAGRSDLRFDGAKVRLVTGPAGGPPSGKSGLAIDSTGKVGIGNDAPAVRLDVAGDIIVRDSSGLENIFMLQDGSLFVGNLSGATTTHVCADGADTFGWLTLCNSAAEYVPAIDGGTGVPETADLVSIAPALANPYGDAHGPFVVRKSATACDTNLLGFIVDPALGADGRKLNDRYLPLAIYGYFPAKVTLENGPIKRGDPITSSSTPGRGMKATEACRIVGYALEDADRDTTIQVFAHLGESASPEVGALRAQVAALQRENAQTRARLDAIEQMLGERARR